MVAEEESDQARLASEPARAPEHVPTQLAEAAKGSAKDLIPKEPSQDLPATSSPAELASSQPPTNPTQEAAQSLPSKEPVEVSASKNDVAKEPLQAVSAAAPRDENQGAEQGDSAKAPAKSPTAAASSQRPENQAQAAVSKDDYETAWDPVRGAVWRKRTKSNLIEWSRPADLDGSLTALDPVYCYFEDGMCVEVAHLTQVPHLNRTTKDQGVMAIALVAVQICTTVHEFR